MKKAISYAFATSPISIELGFAKTGCYFVETFANGNSSTDLQVGGFESICDDLRASFLEADGEICQESVRCNPQYYRRP